MADPVVVLVATPQPTIIKVAAPQPTIVNVTGAGPPGPTGSTGSTGPQGPQGPAGAGGFYVHDQASSSATWTIVHNLGFKPNVQVFDSAGDKADGGALVHSSVNQTVITWSAAFGGLAYLS